MTLVEDAVAIMIVTGAGSRTTASSVAFHFPFCLGKDARELPAGTYPIFTHEDTYQTSFEPIYVVVEVELVVETNGVRTSRLVRPVDLRIALERDAVSGKRAGLLDRAPDPAEPRASSLIISVE